MASYSISRINAFETCPYQYKLRYIDKVRVKGNTIEAFMGSIVHETLEKLYKDLQLQMVNSLQELLEYFNRSWDAQYDDDIKIVKKEYSADNYRKTGEKCIMDYYERFKPFDQMKILGIETQAFMDLPDGNRWHIRIDKLGFKEGIYYVCDYKTNSSMLLQDKADKDRQLAMYSIWVKQNFPDAKKVMLVWHMLKFDADVISERDDDQLERLQEEIVKDISKIESAKEFPTKESALCDYCGYQEICPLFSHKFEIQETVRDDGKDIVDELSELQEKSKMMSLQIDKLKSELIRFAAKKDIEMVYGSKNKARVRAYDKVIFPEDNKKLIELLKQSGLYEDVSSIQYQKLSSLILRHQVDEDIASLMKIEKGYRISLSKRD